MNRLVVTGVLLVTVAVATSACGSSATRLEASLRIVVPRGNLVGVVHISHGGAVPWYRMPAAGGLVVVYDLQGRVVARQRVQRGHGFKFRLVRGHYRLGYGKFSPSELGCAASVATVRPGRTTHQMVQLRCGLL